MPLFPSFRRRMTAPLRCLAGRVALATAFVLVATPARAQQDADSTAIAQKPGRASSAAPARILSLWTAGASDQALATRLGWRHDRSLFMLGIEHGWLVRGNASGSRATYYLAGILPFTSSTGMPTYTTTAVTTCKGICQTVNVTQMQSHTVHAFGVMPVGFASLFRVSDRFATRVRGGAGLLAFSEPIPDPLARRVNFTFDIGATLDVRVTQRITMTGGMRVNHISNGYTAKVNPGMNSFMPEIGFVLGR